jgi:hypothetical protein
MYPAWRGAACDLASEARWIAAEAVFSRSSKGLGAGNCCGYTGLAVYAHKPVAGEQHDALFHKPSRTYPSKAAGPPFAELRRVV